MFQHHRLEQNEDGYTLILYLDKNQTEFASELGAKDNVEKQTDLQNGALQYIREKVPNIKVKAVKILLGSMMIATIPLTQSAMTSHAHEIDNSQITYNVTSGDTLYSIANKYNMEVNDLKAVNNLTENVIKQGQTIVIPSISYTVKSGDTLYSIARTHDISVDTLKTANHLTSNIIKVGDSLKIPSNETNFSMPKPKTETVQAASYKVQAGDTLYSIANKYNVSVDALKSTNNLATNTIKIGQQLTIPTSVTTTPTKATVEYENDNYTVKGGDTLIGIASMYKTSVDAIKKANGLTSDLIIPGQVLTIPTDAPSSITQAETRPAIYTVKSGDTLFSLAANFDLSVNEIKTMNGLTSDHLYVGQTLRLDSSGAPTQTTQQNTITYKTHTVQSGDNIWNLSSKYGIPQAELLRANNLTTSSTLSIGQKLTIPVHNIAVQPTVSEKHGEYLDWWTEAQYVFPIGSTAKVTDFQTGKSFYVKRTIGANHADVEPVTSNDTAIIKDVFGGFNWIERAIIVEVNGHRIAASMTSMPHDVSYIKDNNFNGHTDIHFKNSTRHKDGQITPGHQQQIQIAAGVSQQ